MAGDRIAFHVRLSETDDAPEVRILHYQVEQGGALRLFPFTSGESVIWTTRYAFVWDGTSILRRSAVDGATTEFQRDDE